MIQRMIIAAAFVAALAGAAGCKGGKQKQAVVRLDGSSTVFLISQAVAEDFEKQNSQWKVTIGVSGTGGGFKKFCAGETDVQNASRPIKKSEAEACAAAGIEYIELPVAFDGLAVVVNPRNTWAEHITTAELKKIWEPAAQGKVMRWSHVRPDWPDKEIHLYGPGVDSGTYDYFTEAIVHKAAASRGDFTSSEDDNVLVQGIASDEGAIGFFGLAYFEENRDKLKLLPVDDGSGKGPVAPSVETVMKSEYQPLSRPLFIYVNKASLDRPEVKAFMNFYIAHAMALSAEVGYIPLPDAAYRLTAERLNRKTTGSLFLGGKSLVGVRIQDLLANK
jgi:phosphate transport system substrate-binding protein